MLVIRTIASHEADLRESVLESDAFSGLGIFNILFERPISALRDLRDDEAARDIRDPVAGEFRDA